MSSVAMSLFSEGIKIDGQDATPLTLNNWLTAHGGYVNNDDIIWNSVSRLGRISVMTVTRSVSTSQLKTYVDACHPIVVNVRGGSHWVLITGATSDPNVWRVNDPGFNQDTYTHNTMLDYIIYKVSGMEESNNATAPIISN